MKKICIISNYNLYESKKVFSKHLEEGFKAIGVEILHYQWQKKTEEFFFSEIQRFKPDLIASFNSYAPTTSGQYVWDLLQIPSLFMQVDPCLYYSKLPPSEYLILSSVDRNDVATLKGTYGDVFFLPHGTDIEPYPEEEKSYPVTFMGSCYDYEGLKDFWQKTLPKDQQEVIEEAAEAVLGSGHISLMQALVNAWSRKGLSTQNVDFMGLFYCLDYYTRGKDRVDLIRSFKNTPVYVWGELAKDHESAKKGWGYYLGDMPNVTLLSSLNYELAFQMQKRSKVCLNSSPFFKNGSHERILNSFSAGAVPITSASLWTEEEFVQGEELFIYTPGHYEGLEESVQRLLEDEGLRREMVDRGREKVAEKHTWKNRAEIVLECTSL